MKAAVHGGSALWRESVGEVEIDRAPAVRYVTRMNRFDAFELGDLKLVYGVLQAQLLENEALMDSPFLSDLQDFLRSMASSDGVDTSDHAAWVAWLAKRTIPPAKASRLRLITDA